MLMLVSLGISYQYLLESKRKIAVHSSIGNQRFIVKRPLRQYLLTLCLVVLAPICAAQFSPSNPQPFGSQPEFLPVEQAYHATLKLQPTSLQVDWVIQPSYYLYKHQFAFELNNQPIDLSLIKISEGIEKFDDFFGDVEVFYDASHIQIDLNNLVSDREGSALLKMTSQGCADAGLCYPPRHQYYELNFSSGAIFEVELSPPPKSGTSTPETPSTQTGGNDTNISLGLAVIFALLGGLILNIMPCVLPVLSLKALSFLQGDPKQHRAQAWSYSAGVIISFVAIAGLLIALQQAGQLIGWGFQLQSPTFVAVLIYLFFILSMALIGSLISDSSDLGPNP